MATLAPHLQYHSSEDTEHTFKNKANSKGFCVTHPDIQVRIKKAIGNDVIIPCPKCKEVHDLDLKNKRANEKMDRAIKKAAAEKEHGIEVRLSVDEDSPMPLPPPPVIQSTVIHSPVHYPSNGQVQVQGQGQVIYQIQAVPPPTPTKPTFSSEWFDCCADPLICCFVTIPCCFPFAALSYASKIGASDTHGLCSLVFSIVATVCCPCGIILCKDNMLPCWSTALLKRGMGVHHVTNPPDPCGDIGCCNFWLQLVFCAPCTLCMLHREVNKFPVRH